MKTKDRIIIILLVILYISELFILKRDIFNFRFDKKLIDRYFLSQDIPHEVKGQRLFLSDSDIYLATGYLFATGSDPSLYNFEHPPLIKYLFGFSVLQFNNPYWIQIFLGSVLIAVLYFTGLKIYGNRAIALIACILLIRDPLFIDVSGQTLLDLGQTLFFLLYFLSIFFYRKNFLLQGVFLGLFAGTKFWIAPAFFIILFVFYKTVKKQINWKVFILHLIIGFVTYSALYARTFFLKQGFFNIIYFYLRVLKYRIVHNTSTFLGSSLIMFLSGYFKTWWGNGSFARTNIWSVFWPVSLLTGVIFLIKKKEVRKFTVKKLTAAIPLLYLIYLGVQAPFPRYFLIILPFAYLSLSVFFIDIVKKYLGASRLSEPEK